MKGTWSTTTFVFVSLCVAACGRTSTVSEPAATASLDRACQVVVAADDGNDETIKALQQDVRQHRNAARAAERLGYDFVSRARVFNDPGYYTVAERAAACLESITPNEPAALLLRGHALHQMHRFSEAEAIGRRLVAMREFVLDFGLLGDALMEQGRLGEAADAYQKMIDLKPFYQSYTRAAHLRWLKGDLDGAIAMMRAAVQAASPRDRESVAWAYARLATYELQRGGLAEAARMADASLQYVPDYAAALLARGRIQLAESKSADAVATLERAARRNPSTECQWTLADALRAAGRNDEASAIEDHLIAEGPSADPRTLALYLSTRHRNPETAIDLARREMNTRHDVFTLDALAWALAASGQAQEASAVMAKALAEGTEDGRLFLHAAVIAAANRRTTDAARLARKAHALRFTLLPSELGVLRGAIGAPPHA